MIHWVKTGIGVLNAALVVCMQLEPSEPVITAKDLLGEDFSEKAKVETSLDQGEEVVTPLNMIGKVLEGGDRILARHLLEGVLKRPDLSKDERALAILLQASISLENGNVAEAIVWLHTWLDEFPAHPELPYVHFLMGQCYLEIGAFERARDAFYNTLSTTVVKASNTDEPLSSYPLMLSKVTKWALAETEYQRGDWERARELFSRFKNQEPDVEVLVEGAMYREADCAYQLKRIDDAMASYENALAVGPFHPFAPEAWLRLIELYGAKENEEKQTEAMRSFIWVVQNLDPENSDYWQERCGYFLMANWGHDVDGQLEILAKLSKMEPSKELEGIRHHYVMLLDRKTEKDLPVDTPKEDSEWGKWKKDFQKTQDLVRSKIDELEKKKVRKDEAR